MLLLAAAAVLVLVFAFVVEAVVAAAVLVLVFAFVVEAVAAAAAAVLLLVLFLLLLLSVLVNNIFCSCLKKLGATEMCRSLCVFFEIDSSQRRNSEILFHLHHSPT